MDVTKVTRHVKPDEGYGYWDELTDWCVNQFGYPGKEENWDYAVQVEFMDFYFRDPTHADFFILKWM